MRTKSQSRASANTGEPAQRHRLENEPRNRLAFMAGKNSARDGTACPYAAGTIEHFFWMDGRVAEMEWQDAD
jgi:hypothetical protein